MKIKYLLATLAFLFHFNVSGQTYSFSKVIRKANVQTASGKQYRVLGTTVGPFRFEFETPNNPQIKRIFTILGPNDANGLGLPFYGLLSEGEYLEKDGKYLKKFLYLDGGTDEKVLVLIANDYSMIVIFRPDDTIWEYVR